MVQKRGKPDQQDSLRSRRVCFKRRRQGSARLQRQGNGAQTLTNGKQQHQEPQILGSQGPHVQLPLQNNNNGGKKALTLGHQILDLLHNDFICCCQQLVLPVFTPRGVIFRSGVARVPEEVSESPVLPRVQESAETVGKTSLHQDAAPSLDRVTFSRENTQKPH